jgi:hypothetical protein
MGQDVGDHWACPSMCMREPRLVVQQTANFVAVLVESAAFAPQQAHENGSLRAPQGPGPRTSMFGFATSPPMSVRSWEACPRP